MGDISLEAARQLAKYATHSWNEIRNDDKRKVLFFKNMDDDCKVRRVIVYYERNVICVVVQEGKNKCNSFLYRVDADTAVLARLLESPRLYKVFGFLPGKEMDDLHEEVGKKVKKVKKKKKDCDDDKDDLRDQVEALEKKIKELQVAQKKLKEKLEEGEKKKKAVMKPMLRSYVREEVLKELRRINLDTVECLQLTPDGKGIIHSEKDGEVYWTSAIAWDAGETLRTSRKKRRPETLCLGTHDRYFVRFSDGEVEYGGPDEFERLVNLGDVHMVAFGQAEDSYVVLFKDGGAAWSKVPVALRRALVTRKPHDPRPTYIALGADDAYFVRFGDNVQYGNLGAQAQEALDDCPGLIKEVSFGAGDALVARYEVKE